MKCVWEREREDTKDYFSASCSDSIARLFVLDNLFLRRHRSSIVLLTFIHYVLWLLVSFILCESYSRFISFPETRPVLFVVVCNTEFHFSEWSNSSDARQNHQISLLHLNFGVALFRGSFRHRKFSGENVVQWILLIRMLFDSVWSWILVKLSWR